MVGADQCGLPEDDGERLAVAAADVLDRAFSAGRPNQKWIAAVIDLFSRRVVGWWMRRR
jgi:putative transposase